MYRGRPSVRVIEALQTVVSFLLPAWVAMPLIAGLSGLALWVLRDVS